MTTDLQAAIDKLKADPDLRKYLAMAKHFGCTVEEAKFRYANEKAFRETVLLLAAEAESCREDARRSRHSREYVPGVTVADAAAQRFPYRRGV